MSFALVLSMGMQELLITAAACVALICLTHAVLCCSSGLSRKPVRRVRGMGGVDVFRLDAISHNVEEKRDNLQSV